MNTDWRWFKFRYTMRVNGDAWFVWDNAYNSPVGESYAPKDVIKCYIATIELNEMELAYGKQPA